MSNRTDVKDLENSLPPWVSEHLEEKSIMTDKVYQLLDSPREDPLEESPTWDDSYYYTEDPRMGTSSSFEKEINVMTQDDLDRLRENYSFPVGIQDRIPEEGDTILFSRPGEVAFYEVSFLAGLRLLIHPTIKRILNF